MERSVQYLKGVGPKRVELFKRLCIENVEDLLYFLPWRYEDRSRIRKISELSLSEEGSLQTIAGKIRAAGVVFTSKRRMKIFEVLVEDASGIIAAKWFNQEYLKNILKKDQEVILSGSVKMDRYSPYQVSVSKGFYLENPHFEVMADGNERIHTGRIVPIYHETQGLTSKQIRVLIRDLLDSLELPEFLPLDLLSAYRLPSLKEALTTVHFPEQGTDLQRLHERTTRAHKRLSFEEFFLMELGLALRKKEGTQTPRRIRYDLNASPLVDPFLNMLPYALTTAQKRVFSEIRRDMAGRYPMHRLIQGDVGCGKTVIALMALLTAVENHYQTALLVPTEILAEQHFLNMKGYLERLGVSCWLLTGRMRVSQRKKIYQELKSGFPGIAMGTHALLTEEVRFGKLGLVVIDEQHKFGVLQRAAMKEKGYNPDLLVMTATPIPRTLAMSLYGDLEVSVVDELPPGRVPVSTRFFRESDRWEAYRFLEREVRAGRQGYVVYPLVEESEKIDLKAATEMARDLEEKVFPDFRIGLLHGKMKGEEKERVMAAFKANKIHVLVATTVIEVGVDVSNATVMIIEHAERFGLAQLHQLRGRVGRGGHTSHCLLVTGSWTTPDARRRIEAMIRTTDGFKLAEEDLEIRGPGEFLGTRQSGLPELRVANLIRDVKILEKARVDAFRLVEEDPLLSRTDHLRLRRILEKRWKGHLKLGTV